MKTVLMKAIMTSISEVMETMFFLFVEFDSESTLSGCKLNKEKTIACRLIFNGDVSGSLLIVAPKILVVEMAETFMGKAKGVLTDKYFSGTLAEMLNMVCGNAFSKIDTKVPFELGIPQTIDKLEIQGNKIFTIIKTTESKMAILLKTD